VEARGDEGTVFVMDTDRHDAAVVFRAIEFAYHLKAVMAFASPEELGQERAPHRLDIGAGIHVGPLAWFREPRAGHSVISGLEGYAINYAKRVESCSRKGRHSQILLSPEAAARLALEPAVLCPMHADMKGIGGDVQLFEVESGLFEHMELRQDNELDRRMICAVEELAEKPGRVQASWTKALIVSVLEALSHTANDTDEKVRYRNLQLRLAWYSTAESDPILLYLRSLQYRERGEHTQELRYLRQIAEQHPEFIHIRPPLVKACWRVAQGDSEPAERVYARDVARELLDHFRAFLSEEDRDTLKEIAQDVDSATRAKEQQEDRTQPSAGEDRS
jgi:hypothetical protein